MVKVRKNLAGEKFGRLTVLYQTDDYVNPKGKHYAKWHCKCECGNEVDVSINNLRSGETKSCGCLQAESRSERKLIDLSGMRFGRLLVIKRAEKDYMYKGVKPYPRWECLCDCGSQTIVKGDDLRNGTTLSCGCLKKDVMSEIGKSNKQYNDHESCGKYVKLFDGNNVILVDTEDYDKIKDIYWSVGQKGYVSGDNHGVKVRLHRFITDCPPNLKVDHMGGEKTRCDNRKSNLRISTDAQNDMNKKIAKNNSSGVTGVGWNKEQQKWAAKIGVNRKRIFLGYYANFDDAVKARKEAEEKYFGEWSYDNSQKLYRENNKTDEGEVQTT